MVNASTHWTGDLQKGKGKVALVSSELGEFEVSLPTRLQAQKGHTTPEELLAAAYSSCLAMNFSGVLAEEGLEAEHIDVSADARLGADPAGGNRITIALTVRVKLAGVDADRFAALATKAKDTCPVGKALASAEISMDAALV